MSPSEIAGVPPRTRNWIARAFSLVEDVAYIGLGLLLAGCAIALLIDAVYGFMHQFATTSMLSNTVGLLDRILLILVVIELLYTVQVSFREHAVAPEPFLLVGV